MARKTEKKAGPKSASVYGYPWAKWLANADPDYAAARGSGVTGSCGRWRTAPLPSDPDKRRAA